MYLIDEGIGPRLNLEGLHFVTIRATNQTFNIYNFSNANHLLAWEHYNIRQAGHVGSLVFLEVSARCQEGPGVLWMCCPVHLAAQFTESLHKLVAIYIIYSFA